ncbi:serine/threonine-protein kinase [Nonomuraea typhae]|uniref:non-specific serine/threonine protein kinase n=1 Tax=Nonomuraea typhae TaxID=2603600 RepID=A0ABW7YMY6_9ACTN
MQGEGHHLLAGRYRLIERLGEGGAGTVWRAADETLHRAVAVKQVRVPRGLSPQERNEFAHHAIDEARAAGRLRDPAIVVIHDVVLEGDQPWIIMDLATGRSLDKVVKEHGPLPPAMVARIGLSVLSALETAHAAGIVHQDVKPGNILLDADGSAMLTDFGIAAPLGGRGDRHGSSGSPGYMAPERLNGHASGPASDLWSLGASLYTVVEGRAPFERAMPAAIAAAVLLHDPPVPARAGRELGGLLMAMLAKDPAARPAAPQIRAALMGAPPPAAPRPPARRRRWVAPAVAALAVAILAAGGWYGAAVLTGKDAAGKYAEAPDPCALLPAARAGELLKAEARAERTREGECRWRVWRGSRTLRELTVRARAEQPRGDLDGPAVARRLFDAERVNRAAAEGVTFRVKTSGVTDVAGVGEAAFAQHAFKKHMTGPTGQATATVMFRDSNLIGEVLVHVPDAKAVADADRQAAEQAAKAVAAAL